MYYITCILHVTCGGLKPGSEQSFRKNLPGRGETMCSAIPHLTRRKVVPLEPQHLRAEWFVNLSEPGLGGGLQYRILQTKCQQ